MADKHPVVVPDEGALTIFTDGSSYGAPRRGGIGVHFVYVDKLGNESTWDLEEPGVQGATNNQMELLAVITAMKAVQGRYFPRELLDPATKIEIYADSRYVVDNQTNACFVWPKEHWMTAAGTPVQNAELWKEFVRELKKLRRLKKVNIEWGKGHSVNNPHNKVADQLAKRSAARATRPPLTQASVRRKLTDSKTDLGSVEVTGQRLTIRIVSAEYLRTQKVNKYRYEVMSPRSPFFGFIDVAYSTDPLMRAGHTYRVSMNDDQRYPMIVKCHAEVVSGEEDG